MPSIGKVLCNAIIDVFAYAASYSCCKKKPHRDNPRLQEAAISQLGQDRLNPLSQPQRETGKLTAKLSPKATSSRALMSLAPPLSPRSIPQVIKEQFWGDYESEEAFRKEIFSEKWHMELHHNEAYTKFEAILPQFQSHLISKGSYAAFDNTSFLLLKNFLHIQNSGAELYTESLFVTHYHKGKVREYLLEAFMFFSPGTINQMAASIIDQLTENVLVTCFDTEASEKEKMPEYYFLFLDKVRPYSKVLLAGILSRQLDLVRKCLKADPRVDPNTPWRRYPILYRMAKQDLELLIKEKLISQDEIDRMVDHPLVEASQLMKDFDDLPLLREPHTLHDKDITKMTDEEFLSHFSAEHRQSFFISRKHRLIGRALIHHTTPLAKTRVVLEADPEFYYHANWVNEKQDIAAEAPKAGKLEGELWELDTRQAFWKMAWGTQRNLIVMLNQFVDGQCDQYFSGTYGKFKVEVVGEPKTEYISDLVGERIVKRIVKISHGDETREMTHLQVVGWWDGSVVFPDVLANLINIVQKQVVDKQLKNSGDILAHCMAGFGRTGTFYVTLRANQLLKQLSVPINNRTIRLVMKQVVTKLREERNYSVQTREQYQLIFEALQVLWDPKPKEEKKEEKKQ